MKTYEKLRKLVYEVIYPDGIPLEFGTQVVDMGEEKILITCKNAIYQFADKDGRCTYVSDSDVEHASVEILGRPLELRDVLRAMKPQFLCFQTGDEYIEIFDNADGCHSFSIEFDLSIPISAQDEDVLEKLIELIN